MTCEEYREKCLNETIQKIEDSIKKKKEARQRNNKKKNAWKQTFEQKSKEKVEWAVDKLKTLKAKRIRAQDSLIVKEGNQNKKQNEKQTEKRKTNKSNEKQRKKGMEAKIKKEPKRKMG